MDFDRLIDIVCTCWLVRCVAAGIITVLTFLIGEPNTPMVALTVLIVLDTITRWLAIAKKTLDDECVQASIWYGIYLAVHNRNINSQMMRTRFQSKILGYIILLIAFHLVGKIIPASFFGADVSQWPMTFICSWLAFVELQSVIENLIDMGLDALKPLLFWCIKKRETLSGVTEEVKNDEGN